MSAVEPNVLLPLTSARRSSSSFMASSEPTAAACISGGTPSASGSLALTPRSSAVFSCARSLARIAGYNESGAWPMLTPMADITSTAHAKSLIRTSVDLLATGSIDGLSASRDFLFPTRPSRHSIAVQSWSSWRGWWEHRGLPEKEQQDEPCIRLGSVDALGPGGTDKR